MKIALVSEHASPLEIVGGVDAGGQNVHVAALAAGLVRTGAEVVVYTRRDNVELPLRVHTPDGYAVEHVDAGLAVVLPKDDLWPYMGDFAGNLEQVFRLDPPDVVHGHFWMSGYAALRAARACGAPMVQTFHALGAVKRRHQGAADTSPRERDDVERAVAKDADLIIATCSDEVRELTEMGVDPASVKVVPCGVDLDLFTTAGPTEVRPAGRHRVVSVGRLVERKGVDDVIRALADLPEVDLIVAGGPARRALATDPHVQRLQALATECGVSDRVEFRGRVDRRRLPVLLRSADAGVCAPWYEPFGIVPLELMACGVPIVASAVGGLLDTVLHDRTGLLVEPRRPQQIADALHRLLSDQRRRRQMAEAAARRGREYSWNAIAWKTRAAYAEVLGRRTQPTPLDVMEGAL